jgi:hypothetical protein
MLLAIAFMTFLLGVHPQPLLQLLQNTGLGG